MGGHALVGLRVLLRHVRSMGAHWDKGDVTAGVSFGGPIGLKYGARE